MNEITINGEVYVKKGDFLEMAQPIDGMDYCIVRTYSAGVFAGYVDLNEEKIGKIMSVHKARRIWKWDGANSLSQLAVDGTLKPSGCMFTCEVEKIFLTEVIEIIPCTKKAHESIKGVEEWRLR